MFESSEGLVSNTLCTSAYRQTARWGTHPLFVPATASFPRHLISRPSSARDIMDTASTFIRWFLLYRVVIVQELCESRGGRPGLSVLTSLLASVDVKIY